MASRKPSARRRQQEAYDATPDYLDGLFDAAARAQEKLALRRERAREQRSCTSKQRYVTAVEARQAALRCESRGQRGLAWYRCEYCGGYHLTSHPRLGND